MATTADRFSTEAQEPKPRRKWWKIALVAVPAIVAVGSAIGYLSNSGFANDWYAPLEKPSFQPPSWAFPVTWTTLYTFMGIAVALILAGPRSRQRTLALTLFFAQLALNFAWSPTFFGAGYIDWALLIILAMNVIVTATIIAAWPLNRVAALLLVPYLPWLCLATALNHETGRLNPGADRAPLGLTGE
ncbi:tryptophan-rich sensory protein [Sphingomonas sp. BN140010]|uniref:Tryptophan-rich sensory protein n=1 Tax=Sphingomonas arvum TaxID=2992113 RepID=A0ABT3JIF3_9SPHN|nr:TspO/MBR family protein [Sphingomonas sp. BN140010]MCW3798876.1 tryptophan-rich sensory protein [Sphingomonas sp. BN140010]